MAHTLNALKRVRQTDKRTLRNKIKKTIIKNKRKAFLDAISKKDKTKAEKLMPLLFKLLDKAGKDNIFHKNKISRIKSVCQVKLNSLKS